MILGCLQKFHPVNWKELDWTSKAARSFLREAIDFGLGNQGLSIPIRGPHGQYAPFTVNHACSDDEWEKIIQDGRRDFILIAHMFNKKALELEPDKSAEPAQSLSPRETETLTLLSLGYSRAQAANTMGISEHTCALMRKVHGTNWAQSTPFMQLQPPSVAVLSFFRPQRALVSQHDNQFRLGQITRCILRRR